jgi:hypothetical protein
MGGMPGLEGHAGAAPHIINDLLFLAEHSLNLNQPIEQEPAHATTKVLINVKFPQQ